MTWDGESPSGSAESQSGGTGQTQRSAREHMARSQWQRAMPIGLLSCLRNGPAWIAGAALHMADPALHEAGIGGKLHLADATLVADQAYSAPGGVMAEVKAIIAKAAQRAPESQSGSPKPFALATCANFVNTTEREGFEPSNEVSPVTRFPVAPVQPLRHLSRRFRRPAIGGGQRKATTLARRPLLGCHPCYSPPAPPSARPSA
jgi:hypothetical protein